MKNNHFRYIKKYIIGQFDISKYDENIKTITTDVVLLPNRLEHIKKHADVLQYKSKIPEILRDPDAIYKEVSKDNTLWLIKKYDNNVKITIKLITSNSKLKELHYRNSIIQMQIMRDKEINRNIRIGKIKKIFDKYENK